MGAALLTLSVTARAADLPLCPGPYGTHLIWYLLNAAMLSWMIAAFHRRAAA